MRHGADRALILDESGGTLHVIERSIPVPGPRQVLLRVAACGLCRTDLHIVDGDLPAPALPVVLGHQVVGMVEAVGSNVTAPPVGAVVGVPWLATTCGVCDYCTSGRENLCDQATFTGYTAPGGMADHMLAAAASCIPLPSTLASVTSAPLLCAGLIGYRSLRMCADAHRIGIFGFGSAGHIITQAAVHQGSEIYAFTRPGDLDTQRFAVEQGAAWAGDSTTSPPQLLDAAIIFASVGDLIPAALAAVRKGGTVVCGGIHMTPIPSFSYDLLWGERQLRSVANLTRRDGTEFIQLAAEAGIHPHVSLINLDDVPQALDEMRGSRQTGSVVVRLGGDEILMAGDAHP